ncbi:neuronal acetylcholine receptor subunit alpha-3-like [Ylistrum balloti]|uniref:neuronal acetylcholine receptor subunit alpha-3-like n=1 Tax=Ylistrum balloti TaxID=509963 RepID=UPI002905DB4B|nr:neuronal acetylcholine receptor subunit alpha-3-like [Ylistrum balloti]
MSTSKVFYVTFESGQVWNPFLILNNPSGNTKTKTIFLEGNVRGGYTGQHIISDTVMTSTSCRPDMSYYPFDRHNCTIKLTSPDYLNELVLLPVSLSNLSTIEDVSQWRVNGFYTYNEISYITSTIAFGVIFQRKPEFIIVNLLTPIVLLCFINLAVFLLPPQSGERVSFSVTMFLSFSVYMTLISEKLPVTNPVSIFTQYLICNVTYSALILFFTTIGLRFHLAENEERIPMWLSKITYPRKHFESKKRKNKFGDDIYSIPCNNDAVKSDGAMGLKDEETITLTTVTKREFGVLMDRVFLVSFFVLLVTANVVYAVYVSSS